jgi:hypothetical protein
MNDLELLRRYEPIVRYTDGEIFFPSGVEEYLKRCSLWMRDADGTEHLLLRQGQMTIDNLAAFSDAPPGATLYMKFVNEPMTPLEYQVWLARSDIPRFKAPGRLARVPLLSRIGDSFFDLSFFIRGAVPGGTTAAAHVAYQEMREKDPRRVYYGRVIREAGWIALHYLFFFPMNPWRSRYNGVNDHESDWEQVFVFLSDNDEGEPKPEWVAFASHDFKGDDLRRRWDDPLLTREGEHPVIFAGAGSHASYFEQGEYIMSVEPKFMAPVKLVTEAVLRFWYETLGQGTAADVRRNIAGLSVPFVDYARGDGLTIGPGQDEPWSPVLISDADPWVNEYRGLWGLDTRDPFGGERAPAGPKYDRDGSVRMAWNDPLGWAGLDKLHPPALVQTEINRRIVALEEKRATLETEIEAKRSDVRALALDVEALRHSETSHTILEEREARLGREQAVLQAMHRDAAEIAETIAALHEHRGRLARGEIGSSSAHLKHAHHPVPTPPRQSKDVEIWAAISGALTLLAIAGILIVRPPYWGWLILGAVLLLGGIEALTRRRLTGYLVTISIGLALVATVILLIEFWALALLLLVIGVVIFMMRDNLRELRAS